MMCARLLELPRPGGEGRLFAASERMFTALRRGYERSLTWALRHSLLTIAILATTIGLNVYLYISIPKGFFPQQDTGRLVGWVRTDQSSSFPATRDKMAQLVEIVRADPAVDQVTAVTGGGSRNSGTMFVALKPLAERARHSGRGGRAAAPAPRDGAGREPLPRAGAGRADRRAPGDGVVPVHAAKRRPRGCCAPGRCGCRRRCRPCRSSPT